QVTARMGEKMSDSLLQRYAELLVGYCTRISEGDKVMLNVGTAALPLARELVRAVLRAGGEPFLRLNYPEQTADLVELAPTSLLSSEAGLQLQEMKAMDAYIAVVASENAHSLAGVDQDRMTALERRMAPVQRQRTENTRWVGSLFPTAASAQEAGMSSDAYARFVY